MNPYGTITSKNGHAALYAALGHLRQNLADAAPAIAPGLTLTSDGMLSVDMYAGRDWNGADSLPYDEEYASVGWVYQDPDTHRILVSLTASGERVPLTALSAAQDVVYAVADAIVRIVGGDTGITRDRRCVSSGSDYGDETIAVTHDPIPDTIARLRAAQVERLAASVAGSLSACHPAAAAQMGVDAWPEVTLYARDDTTVLASVDLTADRNAVVLTGPDSRSCTLYTGDHEALDWRDEEDIVRPVCDAVAAALDTHTDD